jgi:ankyrin repeat protein
MDVNAGMKNGETLLHLLVQIQPEAETERLVEQKQAQLRRIWSIVVSKGANVSQGNAQGEQPMHVAAAHAQLHAIEWLLDNGADVDCCTAAGKSRMLATLIEQDLDS